MPGQSKTSGLTQVGCVPPTPPLPDRVDLSCSQIHEISGGSISKAKAFEIASAGVDSLLGLITEDGEAVDPGALVATKGGDLLGFEGKVVAVLQKELGVVHFFE